MSPTDVVLVLVLAPAVAALVGLPLGRVDRRLAVGCGVGGTLVSLLAALWLARETWDGYPYVTAVPFLGRVDTGIAPDTSALDLRVDGLGGLVAVAVTLVALGVQVYSAGYLRRAPDDADPAPTRYPAYAATVSLFTAAMLLVVQADDLFLVLVGWEVMGICSYLLVGHHSERPAARRAAVQAFLVTRVGDVAFVIGIIVLYAATGTSQIGRVVAQVDEIGTGTATLAALLLVVGVMGKSAQFPFHGWLPDAMEGPTPVSALIHAATMVAAGVVVLARLQALLEAAPVALAALAVVATVTMVGAGVRRPGRRRHQARAGVVDDQPGRRSCSARCRSAPTPAARAPWRTCCRTRRSSRCCSSRPGCSPTSRAPRCSAASTRWVAARRGRPRRGSSGCCRSPPCRRSPGSCPRRAC